MVSDHPREQSDPEREKRIADLRSKLETLGCQLNLAKELSADSEGHRLRFTLDYVSGKISESETIKLT